MGGAGGYACMPEAAKEKAQAYLDSYMAWQSAMGSAASLVTMWKDKGSELIRDGIIPEEDHEMAMYDACSRVTEGSLQQSRH